MEKFQMRRIELQDNEVQELINLMDHGVKHQGLSVAMSAAILLQRIQAAPVVKASDGFEVDNSDAPSKSKK